METLNRHEKPINSFLVSQFQEPEIPGMRKIIIIINMKKKLGMHIGFILP